MYSNGTPKLSPALARTRSIKHRLFASSSTTVIPSSSNRSSLQNVAHDSLGPPPSRLSHISASSSTERAYVFGSLLSFCEDSTVIDPFNCPAESSASPARSTPSPEMYRGRHASNASIVPAAHNHEQVSALASPTPCFSHRKNAESVCLISFDSGIEVLSAMTTPVRPPASSPFTSLLDPSPPQSANIEQLFPSIDSTCSAKLTNPFASPSDSVSMVNSELPWVEFRMCPYSQLPLSHDSPITPQGKSNLENPFDVCPTLRTETRARSVETLEVVAPPRPMVPAHVAEAAFATPHCFNNERPGTVDSLRAATGCDEDSDIDSCASSLASRTRSLSSPPPPFPERSMCHPGLAVLADSINATAILESSANITYDRKQQQRHQQFFLPSHSRVSSVDSEASLDLAWSAANLRVQFDSPSTRPLHRATSWNNEACQPLLTATQPRADGTPRHLRLVASAETLIAPPRPPRAANRPRAGSAVVGGSVVSARGPKPTPAPRRLASIFPPSVGRSPPPTRTHLEATENPPSGLIRDKPIEVLWTTGGPILPPTYRGGSTHVRGLSGCFPPSPTSPPTKPLPPVPQSTIMSSRSFGSLVNGHSTGPIQAEASTTQDYPPSPKLWSRDVSLHSLSDYKRSPAHVAHSSIPDKENQRTLTLSTTARALHSLRQLANKARNKRPTALDLFAAEGEEGSLLQHA